MYTCRFCNSIYTRKDNLNRHLSICKKYLTMSPIEINNIIEELHTKVIINGNNNNINSNNTTIYININPVSKINIDHISTDKMKYIIENYKNDSDRLQRMITDYLNKCLCDPEYPENNSVKYIKKNPPTYKSTVEDSGNIISVVKSLKDTCDLLTDPIFDVLKKKLNECIKKYKSCKYDKYDIDLYADEIRGIRMEFKKDNIKKVLNNFLKYDLLNNIEMKLNEIE